jgi:flagellar biosynthetic protein FliP
MTRAACIALLLALLAPAAHAAESSDVAVPPALAEALSEVEPAALDELVREAKAAAAKKAEARAAEEALAAAEAAAAAEAQAAEAKAREAAVAAAAAAPPTAPAADPDVDAPAASAPPAAPLPVPDAKLAAVLAELDGAPRPAVGTPTPSLQAGVNPLARAGSVFLLALLLGGGLLLHPRSRRVLAARLAGRKLAGLEAEGIAIRARHSLGTGQALVDLELDGVRLLVGVSPARMDVLHTWDTAPAPEPAPQRPSTFLGRMGQREEDAPIAGAAPAPAPPPSVDQLLQAWKGVAVAAGDPPEEEPLDDDDAPWWLEGARPEEKQRIERQAASAEEVAESVLARLRTARTRDVPLSERTGVGAPSSAAAEAEIEEPVRAPSREPRRPRGRALGTLVLLGAVLLPALIGAQAAFAEELSTNPALQVSLDGAGAGTSTAVKLLMTLTLLAVAPALVLSMTSFTRLIVVFSLLRQAVGVQQAPPNQVLIGLALFLTWFVMGPTFDQVNVQALEPYTAGEMSEGEAVTAAMGPMRDFMMANTREADLALFIRMSGAGRPRTRADVPTNALVPAFLISELKTAFQIGFLIYIPFLIIDVVVSTVLLAMGMMVLPPVVISLPFKLLLFVFVDGWNLLVGSMVQSFA